jgi:glycosyltransferase involved in cell wall biosynthesis
MNVAGQDKVSVAVQAALDPRATGGVQANLLSLVRNMAEDPHVNLRLFVPPSIEDAWREAGGPRIAVSRWAVPVAWYRPSPSTSSWIRWLSALRRLPDGFGSKDRALKQHGCNVVHFPYQLAFDTSLPSIYEPWDLQHVHLPHLFDPGERAWRTAHYGRACRRATVIVTATATTKRDVVDAFGIQPSKIAVVPRDSSLTTAPHGPDERRDLLRRLGIPGSFIFYPAMTYAHKNHPRLIEALAVARERYGVSLPLVLSGRPHEGDAAARSAAARFGVDGQVILVGALSEQDLASLYTEARLLAFPSLFEGLGLPLLESMRYGLPIVASRASCIPEVAADAAVYFEADQPDSIAEALVKVWNNADLRRDLVGRGQRRRRTFGWDHAGRVFRAIYRHAAGRARCKEDGDLVAAALSLG